MAWLLRGCGFSANGIFPVLFPCIAGRRYRMHSSSRAFTTCVTKRRNGGTLLHVNLSCIQSGSNTSTYSSGCNPGFNLLLCDILFGVIPVEANSGVLFCRVECGHQILLLELLQAPPFQPMPLYVLHGTCRLARCINSTHCTLFCSGLCHSPVICAPHLSPLDGDDPLAVAAVFGPQWCKASTGTLVKHLIGVEGQLDLRLLSIRSP